MGVMMENNDGRLNGLSSCGSSQQAVSPVPASIPDAVLFLDMDGVVLSGEELWRTKDHRYIPPAKIALVRDVCERTGCKVVVSSTWRFSDETRDLLRSHGIPLHHDWRTSVTEKMMGSIIIGQRRGVEILGWLARHPVSSYAIVDDDDDMLPEQMPYFVRTDFVRGIEKPHADRLVAILAQGIAAPSGVETTGSTVGQSPSRQGAPNTSGDSQ